MPFIKEKATLAVDLQRNISIVGPVGLWGDTDPTMTKFTFASPDLTFTFGIAVPSESRTFSENGSTKERSVNIAVYVLEPTIMMGIARSPVQSSYAASPEKIEELKAVVKEGLLALCAPRHLDGSSMVPEFQVHFVNGIEAIPKGIKYPARSPS